MLFDLRAERGVRVGSSGGDAGGEGSGGGDAEGEGGMRMISHATPLAPPALASHALSCAIALL